MRPWNTTAHDTTACPLEHSHEDGEHGGKRESRVNDRHIAKSDEEGHRDGEEPPVPITEGGQGEDSHDLPEEESNIKR